MELGDVLLRGHEFLLLSRLLVRGLHNRVLEVGLASVQGCSALLGVVLSLLSLFFFSFCDSMRCHMCGGVYFGPWLDKLDL